MKKKEIMKKPGAVPLKTLVLHAVANVTLLTLVMVAVTASGLLSTAATVELGLEHYAEKRCAWCPPWLAMPLNTAINVAYVMFGLHWCFFATAAHRISVVKDDDALLFFIFNLKCCVYGFVQLFRIVFQTRASAIIDQWFTLPFFMLAFVWALRYNGGHFSNTRLYCLQVASMMSYLLVFLSQFGFEISLGCHILLAFYAGVSSYRKHASGTSLRYFFLANFSCAGFVILKVLDHHLPAVHWIFSYISGHFLSKICDVLQIHFVNEFFFSVAFTIATSESRVKKDE